MISYGSYYTFLDESFFVCLPVQVNFYLCVLYLSLETYYLSKLILRNIRLCPLEIRDSVIDQPLANKLVYL